MAVMSQEATRQLAVGNHFSCAMTAVLLGRVEAFGGRQAVDEVLALAGSPRSAEYLCDIVNWISYDEAIALLRAGKRVTRHPQFGRLVGEDAARRLNGSPIAALLRSLGSPENVYRQIATTSTKYSVVTRLDVTDIGPGFAEIVAVAVDGFPRDPDHCDWSRGLLSQPTVLFGLPPAVVEHDECEALGAPCCRYRLTWAHETDPAASLESDRVNALQAQLDATRERLHSVFETASDLIGADAIVDVLAKITDRAAVEIRAPRYLLAIETSGGRLHCHHRGFEDQEVTGYARTILDNPCESLPESWLVVPVRSSRREYGRLLALHDEGQRFFAEERELLEVYARYAASALDGATALLDAQERYGQSSALLNLARALAVAGTSEEIASRLADAVPGVVDCDRVGVYLWHPERGELVRRALTHPGGRRAGDSGEWSRVPSPGGPLEALLHHPRPEPVFIDDESGDPVLRELSSGIGAVASILVPLATPEQFLGLIGVSVMDGAERLEPTPDLVDRLSGVAAQATTALANGRLVDQITHQARHDDLTGLANRAHFVDRLRRAVEVARAQDEPTTVFYVDLDAFKPVNDRYGHAAGDELLISVARRLSACMRPTDLVARLGGDEFAVLLEAGTPPADADAVAARLARAFDEPLMTPTRTLQIAASIGRASCPGDARDAEDLLRSADTAMFIAKRARQRTRSRLATTR